MGTTEVTVEIEADDILQFLADEGKRLDTEAVTSTWTPSEWEMTTIVLFEAPPMVRIVMARRELG